MKRTISMKKIAIWILAILPIVIAAAVYKSLPAEIPIHWGMDGTVDNTAARWHIFLLAGIAPLCTAAICITRRIDPKRENYHRFSSAYDVFLIIFNLFMLVILVLTLIECLYPGACDIPKVIVITVGLLLAVSGNLMPKFKHNYFMGIRTPWTLADETVWYRTHRLAGPLWVVGGLIITISAFLPDKLCFAVILCDVLAMCAVPIVMSYVWFRKKTD